MPTLGGQGRGPQGLPGLIPGPKGGELRPAAAGEYASSGLGLPAGMLRS
jgi:hypothetical protein